MPVKIFRAAIGRNEEKDMVELQDQINEFEKELEEHGMQINNITMSAAIDGGTDEYALYSIVHYSLRTGGEQASRNTLRRVPCFVVIHIHIQTQKRKMEFCMCRCHTRSQTRASAD